MQGKGQQQRIGDFLIEHINKIKSVRNHILKEFYEEHSEERDHFKNMVDQYSDHIRNFINSDSNIGLDEQWPLILIGSIVEVHDLDYNEIDRLKIVPPFYGDRTEKLDCASCLSPVGYALLLKKVGDTVTVKTPLGNCNFMVKSILLPAM